MIYIRTDMNNIIATGHVMRCLSIADALRERGEDATFILADAQATDILKKRGYKFIVLNTQWDNMDSELSVIEKIICEYSIGCMLIDSYQVTDSYLRNLSSLIKTVYIDDVNAFAYPVDAVICYAGYYDKFNYENRYTRDKLFLGTEYTPLRNTFFNCPKKQISDVIENLLLLSGGTDHYNILDKLLSRIEKEKYKKITVICGAYYPKYEQICEKNKINHNVEIHMAVSNIEEYMKEADMAVTAGGTTLYELSALGVPAISYAVADNQLDNVKCFHENGLIDYAGDARYDDISERAISYLDKYHADKELRQNRSVRLQEYVDGMGALRIADCLIGLNNINEKGNMSGT